MATGYLLNLGTPNDFPEIYAPGDNRKGKFASSSTTAKKSLQKQYGYMQNTAFYCDIRYFCVYLFCTCKDGLNSYQ